MRTLVLALTAMTFAGCVEAPAADILAYESCILMNRELLHPTGDDDPHIGYKNVYGCNVTEAELQAAVVDGYPEGTLIVKASTREDQDFPWLLAAMRKVDGTWQWSEYTRNFADEEFAKLSLSESVCTDCHAQVQGVDWVFTVYQPPVAGGQE